MTDEHTKPGEEKEDQQLQDPAAPAPAGDETPSPAEVTDPWAAAFDEVAKRNAPAPEGDEEIPGRAGSDDEVGAEGGTPAEPAGAGAADADDGGLGDAGAGGSEPGAGEAGGEPATADTVDVQARVQEYTDQIEQQAINETAQAFLDRADDKGRKLIRQTNGRLGATINDPDIYRVDPDTGAAQFYNPDTGRPFGGDNPRAQAKAWVDAYNEELRDTFNDQAARRQAEIEQQMAPVIQLLEFTPTFESLDPTRQKMLDALIEDYEIQGEDGKVIGYSVDLNKALAQVNKQVAAIKAEAEAKQTPTEPAAEPTPPKTPSMDMRTATGTTGASKQYSSVGEALEAIENDKLNKLRNGK